jgi:cell division septation protein DedD
MFGMGVMVGRGTAPVRFDLDQLKRTLESLQKSAAQGRKGGAPEPIEMKEKTTLDFYEVLPKNREDVEMPNLPREAAPAAAKKEAPVQKPAEAPAPPKAETAAAPAPPTPAAAPPPAPSTAAPGKPYTVQVSAVRTEEEARALLDKLRQRGYAGYVEPIAIPEKGTWYRVRMGEFPSKEFAGSTLERLKKDGFAPVVVPK